MSRGQLFSPTFQAQTVSEPRFDNSAGESMSNAFGNIYKQLQAEKALEKEQERYDLQQARLDAQDKESARRFDAQMAATEEQRAYTRSRDALLDARQAEADKRAATRFENEQEDRKYDNTVKNAYANLPIYPTLDLASKDPGLDARQSFYDKAVDENLKTIDDPAAREVARQAALKGIADDRAFATDALASSINTSDDYKALAFEPARQEAIKRGLKGADVDKFAETAVADGLLQQPYLLSRAEMAKARENAITSTDNQLKTQLSVLNALNGRQEIPNENGDTISISSTPTRGVPMKQRAMDALAAVDALNKYDNVTGSWYTGNPAKSFTGDLQAAYNSLMEKGVPTTDADGKVVMRKPTPEELDKALTPGVVAAYAANPSQDTLMDRMSTVISGPKSKEGRLTDEAVAGITNLQKKLAALRSESTPSYITTREKILSPTPYPDTSNDSSATAAPAPASAASTVPPKNVLNTEGTSTTGTDTQKLPLDNVQAYLNGKRTPEVISAAARELIPIAKANGVSDKDLGYMIENGDIDNILNYSARHGSSGIGAFTNQVGLGLNAAATGLGSTVAGIAALPEYITSPANFRQAINNVGFYPSLVNHFDNVTDRLNNYQTKEQLLARYGLTLPKPSVNSIFANDFFTPDELDEMARRQALKASAR
jgi:hypothetical protein